MLTNFFRIPQIQNLKKVFNGARIRKLSPSPPSLKISHIEDMTLFMHKYIERVADVKGVCNCDYLVVLALLSKRDENENHTFVRQQFIKVLKAHKELYNAI